MMIKCSIPMIVMSLIAVTSTAQMFKPQSFYDKKHGKPTEIRTSGFETEVVYKVKGRLFVAIQFGDKGKAYTKAYYKKTLLRKRLVVLTPEECVSILAENAGGNTWSPFTIFTEEMIAKTPDPKIQNDMRREQKERLAWERSDKILYAEYSKIFKVLRIDVHHEWDGESPLVR